MKCEKPSHDHHTRYSVLLLHNLDPAWPPEDMATVTGEIATLEQALLETGHAVTSVAVQSPDLAEQLCSYRPDDHIVFNSCEELPSVPHSENLVTHMIEALGFVYTGSPPDVLALSSDKVAANRLLDRHGLPTPRWRVFESDLTDGWDCFPAIVKPTQEHCSLGMTAEAVVSTPAELRRRIAHVLETLRQPALVQDFIAGREFHVGLWGNGVVDMLPPAEMDFSALRDVREHLCTYESKFCPGSRQYELIKVCVPAPLSPEEYEQMKRLALEVYRVFGCRDYARLDLRLRDGVLYVLDVNANPDISSDTSMAEAARVAGYSYGALVDRLVQLAARRRTHFGGGRPGGHRHRIPATP
jgi:D-alanine-D-alanine ligase